MREFNPLEDEGTAIAHNERLTVPYVDNNKDSVASTSPRGNFNPAGRFWDNFQNWGRQDRTDQNDKIARAQNSDRRNGSTKPANNFPSIRRSGVADIAGKTTRVTPETTMDQNFVLADRKEFSRSTSSSANWDEPSFQSSENVLANGAGSATRYGVSQNTERGSVPIYNRSFN